MKPTPMIWTCLSVVLIAFSTSVVAQTYNYRGCLNQAVQHCEFDNTFGQQSVYVTLPAGAPAGSLTQSGGCKTVHFLTPGTYRIEVSGFYYVACDPDINPFGLPSASPEFGCTESYYSTYIYTVNNPPAISTTAVLPAYQTCQRGTLIITPSPAGNYRFYRAGSYAGEGSSHTVVTNTAGTFAYEVAALDNGCESANRVSFTVTINTAPAPVVTQQRDWVNGADRLVLSLTPQPGYNYSWRNVTKNQQLAMGASLQLNVLPTDYETISVRGTNATTGCQTPETVLQVRSEPEPYNSVHSATYNGQGQIIAESKTYFDRLGRQRQVQVRDLDRAKITLSQMIHDAFGRQALNTLPVPTTNAGFYYDVDLTKGYDYRNFDVGTKVNAPDPISAASKLGTYYSALNTLEPYQDQTIYPFTRTEFYPDPLGHVRKQASPGEKFRMGSGREAVTVGMPVLDELNHYRLLHSRFVPEQDASGIQPPGSNVPSTARSVSRMITKSILRDAHGRETAEFQDNAGNTLAVALCGPETGKSHYEIPIQEAIIGEDYIDLHLTALNSGNPTLTLQGKFGAVAETFKALNLLTDAELTLVEGNNVLAPGFYRLFTKSSHNDEKQVTISYKLIYHSFSYNFYDNANNLVASVPPKTSAKGLSSVGANLSAVTLATDGMGSYNYMAEVHHYNSLKWLLSTNTPDGGTTHFVYRMDGKLRFSQDAKQQADGKKPFSYVLYDTQGRITESGEYVPATTSDVQFRTHAAYNLLPAAGTVHSYLELANQNSLPVPARRERSYSLYDVAAPASELTALGFSGFRQRFLHGRLSKTWNDHHATYYSYDSDGRLEWTIQKVNDMPSGSQGKLIRYVYDFNGRLLQVNFQPQSATERFSHYYTYDLDGRLIKVETSKDDPAIASPTKLTQVTYEYYLTGGLKRKVLGGNLQGVDYVYTLQGWLKSINHPSLDKTKDPGLDGVSNGIAEDAFGMALDYHIADYLRPGKYMESYASTTHTPDQYTGNIKAWRWRIKLPTDIPAGFPGYELESGYEALYSGKPHPKTLQQMYVFRYDRRDQLTDARFGTFDNGVFTRDPRQRFEERGITYDPSGNISTLNRSAYQRPDLSNNRIDSLLYHYYDSSNKLKAIHDRSTTGNQGALGDLQNQVANPANVESNYAYDALGELTEDVSGNIRIEYNIAGLVSAVRDRTTNHIKVDFIYTETGQRLRKRTYNATGAITSQTYYIWDGIGNLLAIYGKTGTAAPQLVEQPIYGSDRIGTHYRQLNTYRYELKDHLGNVRAVVEKKAQVVTQHFADYYPFGWGMPGRNSSSPYRFGFQGQENDPETGWSAFELRMWDGRVGRWMTIDPKQQYRSPYLGLGNNPINGNEIGGGLYAPFTDFIYADGTCVTIDDGSDAVFYEVIRNFEGVEFRFFEFHKFDVPSDDDFIDIGSVVKQQQILNLQNPNLVRDQQLNTFCNFATQNIFRSLSSTGAQTDFSELLIGRANHLAQRLERGINTFQPVTASEAATFASEGALVIGVYENPDPERSGHIAALIPDLPESEPMFSNVGFVNGLYDQDGAFGRNPVSYYVYGQSLDLGFGRQIFPQLVKYRKP